MTNRERPLNPTEKEAARTVIGAWMAWANVNYPQDLGDEGGWDEEMLDEFLLFARRQILEDAEGTIRP